MKEDFLVNWLCSKLPYKRRKVLFMHGLRFWRLRYQLQHSNPRVIDDTYLLARQLRIKYTEAKVKIIAMCEAIAREDSP